MNIPRLSPRRSWFLAASLALIASAPLSAAQVTVEFTPEGISVGVPGGIGASGAAMSANRPLLLVPSDFAANLTVQMNLLARPAADMPPSVGAAASPAQLRAALQEQNRWLPRGEVVATQHVLLQALLDPQALAAVKAQLLTTTPSDLLGKMTAEKLTVLAASVQNEKSRAELSRYARRLESALAGDRGAFDRLFDGRDEAAPSPVNEPVADPLGDFSGSVKGKIQRSLAKPAAPNGRIESPFGPDWESAVSATALRRPAAPPSGLRARLQSWRDDIRFFRQLQSNLRWGVLEIAVDRLTGPATVSADVSAYRRLVDEVVRNSIDREEYMAQLPAGGSAREELLRVFEADVAPKHAADSAALAALLRAHPNLPYESAGWLRRGYLRATGQGPKG
jgi:hypothetical protein